jgi:hypothetical protein
MIDVRFWPLADIGCAEPTSRFRRWEPADLIAPLAAGAGGVR